MRPLLHTLVPPSWSSALARLLSVLSLAASSVLVPAQAEDQVVNIYSARHYPTDEALYSDFTRATGIRINRVDSDDAGIVARLKAEGSASPADVILLVDAARLWRGEAEGLFLPVNSRVLDNAVPAQLRAKPTEGGGTAWFGLSTRARVVVYDKLRWNKQDVDSYEKLADPKFKGQLCIRSGSHPYNLSLFVWRHGRTPGRRANRSLAQGLGGQHGAQPQGR
jgi:iron(III) transport system substrate-binding protein